METEKTTDQLLAEHQMATFIHGEINKMIKGLEVYQSFLSGGKLILNTTKGTYAIVVEKL